jgi:hypothetical protein
MSKNLTKNARWIVFWARFNDAIHSDSFVPYEVAFNIGRFPYDVPTTLAIQKSLTFKGDVITDSMTYEIDVAVFPYSKQFKEVTALAEIYFNNQLRAKLNNLKKEEEQNE